MSFDELNECMLKFQFNYVKLENKNYDLQKENSNLVKSNQQLQLKRNISSKELFLIEEKTKEYLRESKFTLVLYGSRAFNYYLPSFLKLEAKDFDLFLDLDDSYTDEQKIIDLQSFIDVFISYLSTVFPGRLITYRNSMHNAPWSKSILYCGRPIIDVTVKKSDVLISPEVDEELNMSHVSLRWLVNDSLNIISKESASYRHEKEKHRLQRILLAISLNLVDDTEDYIKNLLQEKFKFWDIGKTELELATLREKHDTLKIKYDQLDEKNKHMVNMEKNESKHIAKIETDLETLQIQNKKLEEKISCGKIKIDQLQADLSRTKANLSKKNKAVANTKKKQKKKKNNEDNFWQKYFVETSDKYNILEDKKKRIEMLYNAEKKSHEKLQQLCEKLEQQCAQIPELTLHNVNLRQHLKQYDIKHLNFNQTLTFSYFLHLWRLKSTLAGVLSAEDFSESKLLSLGINQNAIDNFKKDHKFELFDKVESKAFVLCPKCNFDQSFYKFLVMKYNIGDVSTEEPPGQYFVASSDFESKKYHLDINFDPESPYGMYVIPIFTEKAKTVHHIFFRFGAVNGEEYFICHDCFLLQYASSLSTFHLSQPK